MVSWAARLGSCVIAVFVAAGCKQEAPQAAPVAEEEEPIAVETTTVGTAPLPRTLTLTGTLRAEQEAEVAAGAPGRVLEVKFDRGSEVVARQLLVQLDVGTAALGAAEASIAQKSAQVQVEQAARDCARSEELFRAGALAEAEYERGKTQCEASRLAAEAAKTRVALGARAVSDGTVRAPFAGVVLERKVDPGEYVMHASPVATIAVVDRLRLEVAVPELHLAALAVGHDVTFQVASQRERTYAGKVRLVGATVRAATRDTLVEIEVDNRDRSLKPGMFAVATIQVGVVEVPVVPKTAVVKREGFSHVFVVVDSRVEEHVVATMPGGSDTVGIVRGLGVGDAVVAAPPETLRNGQRVE